MNRNEFFGKIKKALTFYDEKELFSVVVHGIQAGFMLMIAVGMILGVIFTVQWAQASNSRGASDGSLDSSLWWSYQTGLIKTSLNTEKAYFNIMVNHSDWIERIGPFSFSMVNTTIYHRDGSEQTANVFMELPEGFNASEDLISDVPVEIVFLNRDPIYFKGQDYIGYSPEKISIEVYLIQVMNVKEGQIIGFETEVGVAGNFSSFTIEEVHTDEL